MGRRVSVASTVVNMAGDEENRVKYLRTTVLGGVLSPNSISMGEHIGQSYITGPGITFRQFGKWVRSDRSNTNPRILNYNETIGFKSTSIGLNSTTDFSVIAPQLPVTAPTVAEVFTATVDQGLYGYWADQWMYDNHPTLVNTAWTVDYVASTNTITIRFIDGTSASFVPAGNVQQDMYLFVKYREVTNANSNQLTVDPLLTLGVSELFPSTTGWTQPVNNTTTGSPSLQRTEQVVSTFSDNRPPITGGVTTTSTTGSYTEFTRNYEKNVTERDPITNTIRDLRAKWEHRQIFAGLSNNQTITFVDVDIGGGVTRRDTTTVNQQVVAPLTKTTQLSYMELGKITYSNTKIFIYKKDTGNSVLDGIIGSTLDAGNFLPFVPVYIDNKFPSKTYLPEIYSASKKAYRRFSRGQMLSKVTKQLKKNESLPDIDYTFCVFGVSLNVVEMACKEYLFMFFDYMRNQYAGQLGSFEQWLVEFDAAKASQLAYDAWLMAQGNEGNPLNGTPAPIILPYPKLPEIKIRTYSDKAVLGYDQSVSWSGIKKETFTGLGNPTAKKKDYWIEEGPTVSRSELVSQNYGDGGTTLVDGNTKNVETLYFFHQNENNQYERLTLLNLKHRNIVFEGHYTEVTGKQALNDPEESAFIVPLHEIIYKEMPLISSTQMTTACSFLVFNSYVVKKVRWYQKGIFRVLIVIAAIAISAYSGGTSLGATSGILGTNGAVGAAAGFASGSLVAAIAGAALNAIASLIVFNIISGVAMNVLGAEFGAILAAVAMVLLQNPALLDSFGSSLSTGFSQLLRADNMLKLTDAVGQGMQAANVGLAKQMQTDVANYNSQASAVRKQFFEQFGDSANFSAAPYLLNQASTPTIAIESLDAFLSRTLLSGTDIASLSQSLLSDFAAVTLDLANS